MSDPAPAAPAHDGVIRRPDEVTPEFLAGVLGVSVTGFTSAPVGTGQMGDSVRYRLDPVPDPSQAPASVVVKFAAADEASRATGLALRGYEVEVRFYQEVARTVGMRTPVCHHAAVDPATGWFTLVLEDLAPALQGDQIAGCSLDEAALAVAELAQLHAPRWGDPALGQLEWLDRNTSDATAFTTVLVQSLWTGFADRYQDRLSTEELALGERVVMSLGDIYDQQKNGPQTVVHGDFRLDNLMFGTEEGGAPIAVVDWQTCVRGPALTDVGYFLGAGLQPKERAAVEVDLLRDYHARLIAGGVGGYGWDQLWQDYRGSTFAGLLMAIAASMIVERTPRGDDMFMAMATRHAAHIIDLEADRLLP